MRALTDGRRVLYLTEEESGRVPDLERSFTNVKTGEDLEPARRLPREGGS